MPPALRATAGAGTAAPLWRTRFSPMAPPRKEANLYSPPLRR